MDWGSKVVPFERMHPFDRRFPCLIVDHCVGPCGYLNGRLVGGCGGDLEVGRSRCRRRGCQGGGGHDQDQMHGLPSFLCGLLRSWFLVCYVICKGSVRICSMALFFGRGSLAMVASIQRWGVRSFEAFAGGNRRCLGSSGVCGGLGVSMSSSSGRWDG